MNSAAESRFGQYRDAGRESIRWMIRGQPSPGRGGHSVSHPQRTANTTIDVGGLGEDVLHLTRHPHRGSPPMRPMAPIWSGPLWTTAVVLLVGLTIAHSPTAAADPGPQPCGPYTTNQGNFALAVTAGSVSCQQARGVFDDFFAGRGTQTARNGSTVDGFACVGNPAGAYQVTGVLSFCDGSGAHIELRNP
jgi:hypothetical protein